MKKLTNKIYIMGLVALVIGYVPAPAFAHALKIDKAQDFADAQTIGDSDLDTMRGGFFDVNGTLVSFSYNAITSINGIPQNAVSFTDADLMQAAANGKNLQAIVTPAIIKNANNNAQIAFQQQLNLVVSGANLNAHIGQAAAFVNGRAFR